MAGALSKRQQARNEKTLQDLVQNVPGNNQCADCQARNPGWASWSLGIFLCMRCASIHRKLGTHISKVKSLSMDGWSTEQVENMKKVGNVASNKLYNPDNKRPPIPVDADEADSAIERYIRSKYMNQGFSAARRHHTGSTTSDETPPPLPPKSMGKFSLRSASSTFPLFSRSKKDVAPRAAPSSPLPPRSPEQGHRPKVSKVFGASLGYDSDDDMHKKLAKLRELGFTDDRKNEVVLKGVNGNLERTIESLVRLEGRSPMTSPVSEFPGVIRPPASAGGRITGMTGLTVSRAETARPMSASNNPFDISPVQPISSQSTGNMANRNPYYSNNPFGLTAAQSNDALNQAFNNTSLGAPQPLFPHHTGGLPQPQQQQQVMMSQQSMQPSVPSIPQGYSGNVFDGPSGYPQQVQQPVLQLAQPVQPMYTGYNPFLNNSQQQPAQPQQPQQQTQQLSSLNTGLMPTLTGGAYANNPFARSPTRMATPTSLGQIPEQSQQDFYSSPAQPQQQQQQQQQQYQQLPQQQLQAQQPQPQMNNPFFPQTAMAAPMPQAQFNQLSQFSQLSQPVAQQAPPRVDKASILALYNLPQLAPQAQNTNLEQQQQPQQQPSQQQAEQQAGQALMTQAPNSQNPAMSQADVGGPIAAAGNKNPFLGGAGAPQPAAAQPSGMEGMAGSRSRDSMMALGMEWSNGRHSPDAFANLSARSMR